MTTLLEAIRHAVETSGKTRYRIAKESGITAGQLSRLVRADRGMRVETIQRLADYLGLEIVLRPKRTQKGR